MLFIVIFQSLVMAALASTGAMRAVISFNFYFISHNFVYLCFKVGTCADRPPIKFKTLWGFLFYLNDVVLICNEYYFTGCQKSKYKISLIKNVEVTKKMFGGMGVYKKRRNQSKKTFI